MEKYNWGIIGTGGIAADMAKALNEVNGGIYAAYNRRMESAEQYGRNFGVKHIFENCDQMLADPKLDIVYIATPHHVHYEYILKALQSGKHVLCEKSITVNSAQADEAAVLARKHGLVLMEAMTLYHMPLLKRLKQIVESGAIGKVKMIQVNFGSCKEYDCQNRFFNKELAGGALLDIGVYAAAFARFFMKEKPDTVLTDVSFFETGADEQSGIILKNNCGQMAVISLSMRAKQPKRGVIAGEAGYIEVSDYPRADQAFITYTHDGRVEQLSSGESSKALHYEVEDMTRAVKHPEDNLTLPYSLDVMHLLTEVRKQWGMVYPFE